MIKLQLIITISILLAGHLLAQSDDILAPSVTDTVLRYQGINPVMNYHYDAIDLYLPFEFSMAESEQLPEGTIASLKLRTELALSYPTAFSTGNADEINHYLQPFYNRYLENSKVDPVRYVLGLVQTAAVGYMAYHHIKKYGFWK